MEGAGMIARKIVGKKNFARIRFYGYKLMHAINPPFNQDEFRKFLTTDLGVKSGDTLFIHSSTFKLNINFPPDQVIKLLLDMVGPEGTLLFPCWHFNNRAEEYLTNPENIFYVKKSPTVMGLLPELARRYKNAHRSLHPTSSVVALGKNSEEMTRDHHLSEYPCDGFSPFYRIIHYHGKIIGLGEKPETSLSFVHCVEDELKDRFPVKTRTDKVFPGRVMDQKGNLLIVPTRAAHKNIQNRDIKGFFEKHIEPPECKTTHKKATWFYVADSVKLHQKLERLAIEGKTIYSF